MHSHFVKSAKVLIFDTPPVFRYILEMRLLLAGV